MGMGKAGCSRKEKEMNIVIVIILSALGWALGSVFGHPLIGIGIGLLLAVMVKSKGSSPLDRETMSLVEARTNSYLSEVWAALPAIKRIEAQEPAYALANLQDIFNAHFPEELQREIQTAEEIYELGKIIIVSETKPLIQMKAFQRKGRGGLFKKNDDIANTVIHLGRIYARAGAMPSMLAWPELWATEMGVSPDLFYRGYLDELHEQDGAQVQRLIDGEFDVDKRLDEMPVALNGRGLGSSHNLASRNTLYAEYRKTVNRHKMQAA